MPSSEHVQEHPSRENLFTAKDVLDILHVQHWLQQQPSSEQSAFCERAAALLGPHAADAQGLGELLGLVLHYDAAQILQTVEAHAVLARYGARDLLRHLALFLLDPVPFDSDRFKEVVTLLKEKLELRGRDLFHPLRLALAGRAGEGELDRVILLVDEAAALPFAAPVKTIRSRIVEFCAALD
jgi:nondiscriminating glutamyl-tRNA synthetase